MLIRRIREMYICVRACSRCTVYTDKIFSHLASMPCHFAHFFVGFATIAFHFTSFMAGLLFHRFFARARSSVPATTPQMFSHIRCIQLRVGTSPKEICSFLVFALILCISIDGLCDNRVILKSHICPWSTFIASSSYRIRFSQKMCSFEFMNTRCTPFTLFFVHHT